MVGILSREVQQQWGTTVITRLVLTTMILYSGVTSTVKAYYVAEKSRPWMDILLKTIFLSQNLIKRCRTVEKAHGAGSTDASIADEGFSIIADSSDNLYVTGFTAGNLDNNTSLGYDYLQ